jgi:bifunctional non-homologous end joining protein LigD
VGFFTNRAGSQGRSLFQSVDGRSDFDGLHSRRHDHEVQFYVFDCVVSDGDDLRKLMG